MEWCLDGSAQRSTFGLQWRDGLHLRRSVCIRPRSWIDWQIPPSLSLLSPTDPASLFSSTHTPWRYGQTVHFPAPTEELGAQVQTFEGISNERVIWIMAASAVVCALRKHHRAELKRLHPLTPADFKPLPCSCKPYTVPIPPMHLGSTVRFAYGRMVRWPSCVCNTFCSRLPSPVAEQ